MDANAPFERATNAYLAELYEAQPVMATGMGVHEYDDRFPNLSKFAIADELRRARAYLHEIDKLSLADLSAENRLDYRLARADTQRTISDHEHLRPWERQPNLYANTVLFGLYLLLARAFADVETRAASLRGRLLAAPELLRQARENLQRPPRLFTETAIEAAQGGESLFQQAIPEFAAQVQSQALRKELLAANDDALEAMRGFGEFLKRELLARSDGDFAIGKELFDYHLRIEHFLDETGDDLLEIGRETLEATKGEMARLCREIDPAKTWQEVVAELKKDHPAADALVDYYAREMQRAREFVTAQNLVDIPANESLTVVETPAFERAVLPYAAYMPPAPFEARQDGLFWVTPIDKTRSPEQQEAQLQGHSRYGIVVIALHEAYPGHHLQFSRANRVPSRFRRHFANSNLFVEGWALYCEEMMYEQGFYTDPRVRLMQLKDQLWRACRVLIDVQLHARQMTPEQAVQFLLDEAKLEEPNAWAEVRRYVMSPTQPMSYLLGKRLLLQLRSRFEQRQGARFDLRRFHNELLSYGSAPPRLIREAMLSV